MIAIILGSAVLAFALLSLIVAFLLRRVVPTNRVDIVQSKKYTRSYGKGRENGNVYYAWPSFLPLIGVTVAHFPESVFNVTLKDYDAYDSGRLPFQVDIMSFFRIADSDMAAHRVANFDELNDQLRGVLQGAVRRTLATNKLEEIMEDRAKLGTTFTQEVNDQLKEWGVTTVKTIEFMDIRDAPGSTVIQNIMAKEKSRIDMESRMAVAANNQTAELREIEAQQVVDVRDTEAKQLVGERQAEADKAVGISQQKAEQEVLSEKKVTTEREAEVIKVKEVRAAEIAREVAEVSADQDRKVTIVVADADRQRMELIATGQLEAAKRDAEGIRIKGEAEGAAKEAVLQAEVAPQITLAKEIGGNEGYQTYLVQVENVRANKEIGVAQASALTKADVKVIVNGGTVQGGVGSISELFTSRGGQAIGSMLEGLAQTEPGKAVIDLATKKPTTSTN